MEFNDWWQSMESVFKMENFKPKDLAKTAWECAAVNERVKSLKLMDEIITSENAHEFYKKNPDLA